MCDSTGYTSMERLFGRKQLVYMCKDVKQMSTWYLVFIMMLPSGSIDTLIVNNYDSMDECYYAMDEYVYNIPDLEEMEYNWDFVCLENTQNY
jgi:hypothetical protein